MPLDYLSNDRSPIDLIRYDFARSRAASIRRHNQYVVDRALLTWHNMLCGWVAACVICLGLMALTSII